MTSGAMDFSSDLGESYGWWQRGAGDVLMTCISSANVACGSTPAVRAVFGETAVPVAAPGRRGDPDDHT